MPRFRFRWTILPTLLLVLAAAVGVAAGAEVTLEELGRTPLLASPQAPMLGPVTEVGRTGWNCMPEKAARAKTARAAELPASDR